MRMLTLTVLFIALSMMALPVAGSAALAGEEQTATAASGGETPGDAQAAEAKTEAKGQAMRLRWADDLVLSTEDESISIKIRGNLHFDSRFFRGEGANATQFDIRRGRIDFQGSLYHYLTFRVQGELADSPYLRNAWADYRFSEWLHLRCGQMKPPFSTSWWTTDNNVNFLERGAGTPVYPYFDRGWWAWGDLFGRSLTWNLGGFTGAGMDFDQPRGDVDDHKDWFARLYASPFRDRGPGALQGFHFCLQASLGRQTVPTNRFEERGYRAGILDDRFWTWETENPGRGEIDRRDRYGAELHYLNAAFSASSEYLVTRYEGIRVFAGDGTPVISRDGSIRSWSSWVGWMLTGERKRVGNFGWKQPKPRVDFDPRSRSGPGAWEVLLRYTRTKTSAGLFESADHLGESFRILQGAPEVDEFTAGVNWTWNPMIRWQFNYVRLNGCGLRTGDSGAAEGYRRVERDEMFGLRMILKF